ncbi:MAG TPA: NTP transferase domain-containing protein [Thermoanaerobaculia bacterium]|jgi:molybdopterin-guanine dinucleotide biosynthesis protein A
MRLVILAAGLGTRVAAITGGHSKLYLDCGGASLLDRHLELARRLGGRPLVVARPERAADFRRSGAEVLVEEAPTGMLASLYHARGELREPFCWIGGDLLFSDLAPAVDLAASCRSAGALGAFFYCRTDRFKAKLRLEPRLEVTLTREGEHELSLPAFMAATPRLFDYLATHRDDFLTPAIAAGEPLLIREYTAPVFEIDTPEDLAEARAALTA